MPLALFPYSSLTDLCEQTYLDAGYSKLAAYRVPIFAYAVFGLLKVSSCHNGEIEVNHIHSQLTGPLLTLTDNSVSYSVLSG